MRAIIVCPACGRCHEVEYTVTVKNRIRLGKKVAEVKKLQAIDIRNVKLLTPEESMVIKRIKPYIEKGINIAELADIMAKKLNVKKSKIRHMVSIVKKAYRARIKRSPKASCPV